MQDQPIKKALLEEIQNKFPHQEIKNLKLGINFVSQTRDFDLIDVISIGGTKLVIEAQNKKTKEVILRLIGSGLYSGLYNRVIGWNPVENLNLCLNENDEFFIKKANEEFWND